MCWCGVDVEFCEVMGKFTLDLEPAEEACEPVECEEGDEDCEPVTCEEEGEEGDEEAAEEALLVKKKVVEGEEGEGDEEEPCECPEPTCEEGDEECVEPPCTCGPIKTLSDAFDDYFVTRVTSADFFDYYDNCKVACGNGFCYENCGAKCLDETSEAEDCGYDCWKCNYCGECLDTLDPCSS